MRLQLKASYVESRGYVVIVCGVDLVEFETFTRVLRVGGERFLQRIYTPAEMLYCAGKLDKLAGRFAAKEAIAKAMGTGVDRLDWRDLEVVCDDAGSPRIRLHGKGSQVASGMELTNWGISIAHARMLAIAFVVATRGNLSEDY